jgi:hypothetical protein
LCNVVVGADTIRPLRIGTIFGFSEGKYEFIACGDTILQCKMAGGYYPPLRLRVQ